MSKRVSNKKGGGGARAYRSRRRGALRLRLRKEWERAQAEKREHITAAIDAGRAKQRKGPWWQKAAGAVRRLFPGAGGKR